MNPQNMKRCPRGHYYTGENCPYCPTQYYPVSGSTKASPYNPNTIPTDTTIIATHSDIPLCPHCGKPVRNHVPMPPKNIRILSIKNIGNGIVPWNYGWDGRCEICGHDYNVVMRIDMGSTGRNNKTRVTTVKASRKGFVHDITLDYCSTVLSGVELETNGEKFFLSANELKHLLKTLQYSPILQQLDYYEEQVRGTAYPTETL